MAKIIIIKNQNLTLSYNRYLIFSNFLQLVVVLQQISKQYIQVFLFTISPRDKDFFKKIIISLIDNMGYEVSHYSFNSFLFFSFFIFILLNISKLVYVFTYLLTFIWKITSSFLLPIFNFEIWIFLIVL